MVIAELLTNKGQVLNSRKDIGLLLKSEDDAIEEECDYGLAEPTWERQSDCRDLDVLMFLQSVHPAKGKAIRRADLGQIWLGWSTRDLEGKVTVEDVLNLRKSGVFYDNGLSMSR